MWGWAAEPERRGTVPEKWLMDGPRARWAAERMRVWVWVWWRLPWALGWEPLRVLEQVLAWETRLGLGCRNRWSRQQLARGAL